MFFPRKSCLLSLNLFKKVAFSGSGDELPFASGYELQFLFDENNLNIVTPTQGPKKLEDDDGANANETQQEHKRGSDSEGDDKVFNPIENCISRSGKSSPIEINGSLNWKSYNNEQSKKTDLSHTKTPNTKEGRTLSTSTEPPDSELKSSSLSKDYQDYNNLLAELNEL